MEIVAKLESKDVSFAVSDELECAVVVETCANVKTMVCLELETAGTVVAIAPSHFADYDYDVAEVLEEVAEIVLLMEPDKVAEVVVPYED